MLLTWRSWTTVTYLACRRTAHVCSLHCASACPLSIVQYTFQCSRVCASFSAISRPLLTLCLMISTVLHVLYALREFELRETHHVSFSPSASKLQTSRSEDAPLQFAEVFKRKRQLDSGCSLFPAGACATAAVPPTLPSSRACK